MDTDNEALQQYGAGLVIQVDGKYFIQRRAILVLGERMIS